MAGINFSLFWCLWSLTARCWHTWPSGRSFFLAGRWLPSCCIFTQWRERASERGDKEGSWRKREGGRKGRRETALSGKKWYFLNWFIDSMPMRKWSFALIRSGLGGYLQCSEESFVSSCAMLCTAGAWQGRWLPLVTLTFIASLDLFIYPVKVIIMTLNNG